MQKINVRNSQQKKQQRHHEEYHVQWKPVKKHYIVNIAKRKYYSLFIHLYLVKRLFI